MNRKIRLVCVLGVVCFIMGALFICLRNGSKGNLLSSDIVQQANKKMVLQLNEIGKNADGTTIENVSIDKKKKKCFGTKKTAYRVEKAQYTKKELKRFAKCLKTRVQEFDNESNMEICNLDNDGVMMYYNNSGAVSYISNDKSNGKVVNEDKFDKQKAIKVAEEFVKKSEIIDYNSLVLTDVQIGYTMESDLGEVPLSYQITFLKKAPKDVDGFVGIGPGICIDVNSLYEIVAFTCIDKDIVELEDEYNTLSLEETEDKIEKNQELQLDTSAIDLEGNKIKDVLIDDVEVRLYCDSVNLQQKYMAPYYVLMGKDKDGEKVSLTLPAITDNEIMIKGNN